MAPRSVCRQENLLIWDHAPAHEAQVVRDFIEEAEVAGWLVVKLIPGGLTSVLQVCDLACNAPIKRQFNMLYMQWRAASLRAQRQAADEERRELIDNGEAPSALKLQLKRDRRAIIRIVQRTFKCLNEKALAQPLDERPIRKTFHSAGQAPDEDLTAFNRHLNQLSECASYHTAARATDLVALNQRALDISALDESLARQFSLDVQIR